jgi:hypothetical protein
MAYTIPIGTVDGIKYYCTGKYSTAPKDLFRPIEHKAITFISKNVTKYVEREMAHARKQVVSLTAEDSDELPNPATAQFSSDEGPDYDSDAPALIDNSVLVQSSPAKKKRKRTQV